MKCDKSLINQIIEIDADSSEIAFLEAARKKGIRFSNTNEYFDYRQRYGLNEGLLSVLKYTTLHKINRYFDSLPKNKLLGCRYGYQYNYYDKEAKYRNLAHDYCDYFTWCKELRYNLKDEFILFPRDFKAAHDETSKIHQQHKDEIEKRKLAKMEKKYTDKILPDLVTKFDYKSEQFMVIIPRCKNDLVKGLINNSAAQNYDGSTNLQANKTTTFRHSRVVVGRMNAWTENDFSYEEFIALNTYMLQKALKRIETLEKKVADLEAERGTNND
ncbi:MAG: PcfJ domain-containing protein [Eubacterium sp.]|nr:PcfJ domain-containing protein [Eubacterium sp.]